MRRDWRDGLFYGALGSVGLIGWVVLGHKIGTEKRDAIGWSLVGWFIAANVTIWLGGRLWEWHRTRIYHPLPALSDDQRRGFQAIAQSVRKMHPFDMERYQEAYWDLRAFPAYERACRRITRIAYNSRRFDTLGLQGAYVELCALGGAVSVAEAVACRDLISEHDFNIATEWWLDLGLPLPVIDDVLRCWWCVAAGRRSTWVVREVGSDGSRRGVCQWCGRTSPWIHDDDDDLPVHRSAALLLAEVLKADAEVTVVEPWTVPATTGGFPIEPGCLNPPRMLAPGQWLGTHNWISHMYRYEDEWFAFDSTGAMYRSSVYSGGLRTSDRRVPHERRELAVWPS